MENDQSEERGSSACQPPEYSSDKKQAVSYKKRSKKGGGSLSALQHQQNAMITACNTYSVNLAQDLDTHNVSLYANFKKK
jgi:hypothetical protein